MPTILELDEDGDEKVGGVRWKVVVTTWVRLRARSTLLVT